MDDGFWLSKCFENSIHLANLLDMQVDATKKEKPRWKTNRNKKRQNT